MKVGEPLYTDELSRKELHALRARNENDQSIAPYSIDRLNNLSPVSHASHQNIPLQNHRLTNTLSDTTPLGSMPVIVSSQRFSGIWANKSLSSSIRTNEMEMQCFVEGTCLGAEGGYDPFSNRFRETSEFNGLPRSKSVHHGIDRFPRNEAPCNSRSGDIGQELLRCNTVGHMNNIPLPARTRCNNNREAVNSRSPKGQSHEGKVSELSQTDAPPDFGDRVYENVQISTEARQTHDIAPKLSNKASEVNHGGDICKSCFMLSMAAFATSLGGAALYSLLSCTTTGCKE